MASQPRGGHLEDRGGGDRAVGGGGGDLPLPAEVRSIAVAMVSTG